MSDAVFLLAAGQGRRAGGPKAWAEHEGKTLLERQLEFLKPYVDAESIRVSVQAPWLERCRALAPEVRWIPVDPEASPLASLQALWRAHPPEGWAFVWHVDMPVWELELFLRLKSAAIESGAEAVAPAKDGRKGHPVVLSPSLGKALLALDPAKDRLDHFLRSRKEATAEVPFDCIHANWNGK